MGFRDPLTAEISAATNAAELAATRLAPGVSSAVSQVGPLPANPGTSIKSIQRGIITLVGGDSSEAAAITAVVTAKSILTILGTFGYGTGLDQYPALDFASSTSIECSRIATGNQVWIRWQ